MLENIIVFVLASFIGFEVISKVPQTLHTPLMSGSNAISGITIIGALILAAGVAWGGNRAMIEKRIAELDRIMLHRDLPDQAELLSSYQSRTGESVDELDPDDRAPIEAMAIRYLGDAGGSEFVAGFEPAHLCRVRVVTGELLSRTPIYSPDPETGKQPPHEGPGNMPGALAEILSGDDGHVYLRDMVFDRAGAVQPEGKPRMDYNAWRNGARPADDEWFE